MLIAVFTLDRVGRRVTLYCELRLLGRTDIRGRHRHVHRSHHRRHRRTLRHLDLAESEPAMGCRRRVWNFPLHVDIRIDLADRALAVSGALGLMEADRQLSYRDLPSVRTRQGRCRLRTRLEHWQRCCH